MRGSDVALRMVELHTGAGNSEHDQNILFSKLNSFSSISSAELEQSGFSIIK